MSAPGDTRSALDQESGASAPSRMDDNNGNGNGRIAVLAPGVAVSNSRTRAENRDHVARQPLLFVAAAMAAGIVVDRYWPLAVTAWLAIAVSSLAIWALLWTANKPKVAAGGHHLRRSMPAMDQTAAMQHTAVSVPAGATTAGSIPATRAGATTAIAAVLVAVAAGGGAWHHVRWRL